MHPIRQTHTRPKIIYYYPERRRRIRNQKSNRISKAFLKLKNYACSVWDYIKIYFNHSCLHCLKYIADQNLNWPQKLIWATVLIYCHIACILIGKQSIQRFKFKSTVIGLERDYHYWNTSMPSLTICPQMRLNQPKFEKYCDAKSFNDRGEREELYYFLESLANSTYYNFEAINATTRTDSILDRLKIYPNNYMELIYNLSTDLIENYEQIELTSRCGPLIARAQRVLTENGICYMMNSLLGPKYSAQYALFGTYPKKYGNESFVDFIQGSFFDREVTLYTMGMFPDRTTISYVHSPFDVWAIEKSGNYAIEILKYGVSIVEIVADDNFETDVTIAQRKCRFRHESNLVHFPIYAKHFCFQECRLNFVYEVCGCIPHFYPNRITEPKNVCDYKVLKTCIAPLQSNFLKLYKTDGERKLYLDCNCLDSCEDAIITIDEVVRLHKVVAFTQGAGVELTVSDWPVIRLKRQVVYSFKDLMISLGSTAGLFLGFSVLSFVELIYFFTIRLVFHICGTKI